MSQQKIEIEEAMAAVDEALAHLGAARKHLGSAGKWGIFDMLAGGAFISLIKRQRIQQAEAELCAAQEAIARLRGELQDVAGFGAFDITFDGILGTADWLFDNVFVDAMIQQRINEATMMVSQAETELAQVRGRLAELLSRKGYATGADNDSHSLPSA